jgi:hypothetical protein
MLKVIVTISAFLGCREDIAWTLQTLSPNALELSRLWHDSGYVSARLLDVASRELQDRLPVKVDTLMFCSKVPLTCAAALAANNRKQRLASSHAGHQQLRNHKYTKQQQRC